MANLRTTCHLTVNGAVAIGSIAREAMQWHGVEMSAPTPASLTLSTGLELEPLAEESVTIHGLRHVVALIGKSTLLHWGATVTVKEELVLHGAVVAWDTRSIPIGELQAKFLARFEPTRDEQILVAAIWRTTPMAAGTALHMTGREWELAELEVVHSRHACGQTWFAIQTSSWRVTGGDLPDNRHAHPGVKGHITLGYTVVGAHTDGMVVAMARTLHKFVLKGDQCTCRFPGAMIADGDTYACLSIPVVSSLHRVLAAVMGRGGAVAGVAGAWKKKNRAFHLSLHA